MSFPVIPHSLSSGRVIILLCVGTSYSDVVIQNYRRLRSNAAKKTSVAALFFFFVLLYGCSASNSNSCVVRNGAQSLNITLKKYADSTFSLISSDRTAKDIHTISEWKLNYPVFHFECADVNADGNDDILVGVIKPTRFDSISRKRIFIFKLVDGYIRPLWLGSRVSQPLEDFKVAKCDSINRVRTIEREENGKYLVADYQWSGFGLIFVKYIIRNCDINAARTLLTQTKSGNENN
jgi:hypothetical protein